jgi:hypothetical protein
MIVHVADSALNIYHRVYILTLDVRYHVDEPAETHTVTVPIWLIETMDDLRKCVLAYLQDQYRESASLVASSRPILDPHGETWKLDVALT